MEPKAVRFFTPWLAVFATLLAGAASAQEFRTPSISAMRVEWRAALDQFRAEIRSEPRPRVASYFSFASPRRVVPRATPALVQLNGVTSPIFPGIRRSPIPVLLPFDTAGYLSARQSGAPDSSLSVSRYQADFRPVDLFDAGPSGYDAVFSLDPGAGDGVPQRTFAKPIEVQITGSDQVDGSPHRFAQNLCSAGTSLIQA